MSNYVYVNENGGFNVVGAFSINSSSELVPLFPPTYLTGGYGSNNTLVATQNSSICQLGPYLYVVNSGDSPTTISGFQITPSTGALSLVQSPISTGDSSGSGITGELLCSPNG